ncbi:hypothetical protein BDZ94DRAFT_1372696, partial [Collybia nuda]
AWILAGFSFNSVEDPKVCKLFILCSPGANVPGRKKLSMSILLREVIKIEGVVQEELKGKYSTSHSDVWKSIAKKHLCAFTFTADFEAHLSEVYDLSKQ